MNRIIVFVDIWSAKVWTVEGSLKLHKSIPDARLWAALQNRKIKVQIASFKS